MILEQFSLHGKIAMVTGASRGLGQGMALGLAEAGADIVGVSRGSCFETAQQVESLGRRFLHLPFDLSTTNASQLAELVNQAIEQMGGLDILVNAAGTTARYTVLDCPEDEWDRTLNVNLKNLYFLSQAAAKQFVAQGSGKIINVSSVLAYQGGLRVPPYTASKHGVLGITRAMANELAGEGVNVNAIAPGYMLTDMTAMLAADPVRNPAIMARIPAGRWGTPEDLKGAVVFLASAASDYCHAMTVAVDGAWMSR